MPQQTCSACARPLDGVGVFLFFHGRDVLHARCWQMERLRPGAGSFRNGSVSDAGSLTGLARSEPRNRAAPSDLLSDIAEAAQGLDPSTVDELALLVSRDERERFDALVCECGLPLERVERFWRAFRQLLE